MVMLGSLSQGKTNDRHKKQLSLSEMHVSKTMWTLFQNEQHSSVGSE